MTKSIWTRCTQQVERVTTPTHGLKHAIAPASGGWQGHITDVLAVLTDGMLLTSRGMSPFAGIEPRDENLREAAVFCEFSLRLCVNCCFSLSVHDCPPFCYASVFASDPAVRVACMSTMRTHWTALARVENEPPRTSPLPRSKRT